MPLNPKIEQVLDMIARAKRPQLHEMTAQQARASYEKSAPILEIASAPMFSVEDLQVPARDGATIRARLYHAVEPSWAEPAAALAYYHGGGFTVGSVDTHDALCRMFARAGRCVVLSVDYRLAVGGDSAGGTLATVCAVLARDAGIKLALQLLIYPGVTGYQQTDSHSRLASGFLLSGDTIQWFFNQYVRDKNDRDDWRFAPLDGTRGAPDFRGLAPAWIATAEYDPLSDEGDAYAEKLLAAGNQVTLRRYAGMIHEFFKMGGFVPDVAHAHADAAAALRGAFGVE